jgi:hypothetical protein
MATEHVIGSRVSTYRNDGIGEINESKLSSPAPESSIVERLERTYTQVSDVRLALETLCGALLGEEKTKGEAVMPAREAFMPHLHALVSAIDNENDYIRVLITRISKGVR